MYTASVIFLFFYQSQRTWRISSGFILRTHHVPPLSRSNIQPFSVFRQRRRSRATRCWWVGSWCRVLVVRSRSTTSSCRSFSCREFTVCCGPKLHLPCDPARCTDATTLHHQLGSPVSTAGPNKSNQEVRISGGETTTCRK